MKCFICQKARAIPESSGGLLCAACQDRKDNPPHVHRFKETDRIGGPDNPIIYSECECGERNMGTLR